MKLTTSLATISILALLIPACAEPAPDDTDAGAGGADAIAGQDSDAAVGTAEQQGATSGDDEEGAVGTAEQALSCTQLYIWYYTYSDSTGNYKWDVTYNTGNGKWYVDEKRIGGGFYKQYILTPRWGDCYYMYPDNETIALKYGASTMTGIHGCLPDGREEVHMPDKQRVLSLVNWNDPCVY